MDAIGGDLSVAASLLAVTAAFREAGTLVRQVKSRHLERGLPAPPELLEEAVHHAPGEIERAKRRGVERFGGDFEVGDVRAIMSIQQVAIQLQCSLLSQLRNACADEDPVDFWVLVDLAESARDETVAALIALRQRMTQPTGSPRRPEAIQLAEQPNPSRQSSLVPPVPMKSLGRRGQGWVDPYMNGSGHIPDSRARENQQASDRRSSSLFGLIKRTPARASSDDYTRQLDVPTPLGAPPVAPYGRSSNQPENLVSPVSNQSQSPTQGFWHAAEGQHGFHAPRPSARSVYGTVGRSSQSEQSRTNSMLSSPASIAPSFSGNSLENPQYGRNTTVKTPSPENDFLGFCKGAWRAQNGDPKAMVDGRDFRQSAQSSMTFPTCFKCSFKGHIDTRKIWDHVVTDEIRGLKYRWAFLAKSHIKHKTTRDRNYLYQCIFCVFAGRTGHVAYSQDTYLDHISRDHRHETNAVLLYATRCVNDRVYRDDEKFDINMFPAGRQEAPDKDYVAYEQFAFDIQAYELAG